MTSSKSTKRALVSSALAILMCVAMLIGTTFAWFTDTASTGVNKIQAGNLKVALMDENENDLTNSSLSFGVWEKNASGKGKHFVAKDNILWEPGCTYGLQDFYIVNKGNLALKYKVEFNGFKGNKELLNALEFTFLISGDTVSGNGAGTKIIKALDDLSKYEGYLLPANAVEGLDTEIVRIRTTVKMKQDAGNEYQGKSLEGASITVYATQYTYETDSISDQYDKDAEYALSETIDLTDEAVDDKYFREAIESIDGVDDSFYIADEKYDVSGKTFTVSDKTNVVVFDNLKVNCKNLFETTAGNTLIIKDCDITIPENGKLYIWDGYPAQVLIVGTVKVNGVELTEENCGIGKELFNKYFVGVGTCFFYSE